MLTDTAYIRTKKKHTHTHTHTLDTIFQEKEMHTKPFHVYFIYCQNKQSHFVYTFR